MTNSFFIAHGIEGLLGARLCHDLACPVSAANNGTELHRRPKGTQGAVVAAKTIESAYDCVEAFVDIAKTLVIGRTSLPMDLVVR